MTQHAAEDRNGRTVGKVRAALYLGPETERSLTEYTRRYSNRFRNPSQAADYLLGRALTEPLDDGTEGIIAPRLRAAIQQTVRQEIEGVKQELVTALGRAVRETARRETEDVVAKYTRALGNRVAAMLVNAGKDAHTAAQLCRVLLLYDLEDEGRVDAYYQEAMLLAGKRYARKSMDGSVHSGEAG